MSRPDIVTLKNVRCSFPQYFKPKASVPGGREKYSGSFLIDPETPHGKANIAAMEAAIEHAARRAWPDKWEKILKVIERGRMCLRDGDSETNADGDTYGGYEGMMVVSAGNTRRPQIVDRDKTPLTEEDGVIYGGCYVDAVVSVYPTSKKEQGGNGIFATLEVVRFRKDGEPFGAAPVDIDDYLSDLDDDEDLI